MQQLNLLNPALRPDKHRLTLSVLAAVLAVAAVGLALSATLTVRKAEQLRQQVQDAETLQRTLQARADQLTALAKRGPDQGLIDALNRVQGRLEATREVVHALDAGAAGESEGFSRVLSGLSRQTMHGVWLTGVNAAGASLDIKGRLLDAKLLPDYLGRLKGDGAFLGRRFGDFVLNDHPEPPKGAKGGQGGAAADAASGDAEPGPARYVEFELKAYAEPAKTGQPQPSAQPLPAASVPASAPVGAQAEGGRS